MLHRTHLDLFSGIGGFALAARWCGVATTQFVEIDARCRSFISKAHPGIPIHDDIKTFHYDNPTRPWLLTGGVPCQPASRAGKQRGAEDDRWLWPEALRVFAESRPAWALFENPPGIGDVGLAGILAGVEGEGYEVRVLGVPACAVGSPQLRNRYWLLAKSKCGGSNGEAIPIRREEQGEVSMFAGASKSDVEHTSEVGRPRTVHHREEDGESQGNTTSRAGKGDVAHAGHMQAGRAAESERREGTGPLDQASGLHSKSNLGDSGTSYREPDTSVKDIPPESGRKVGVSGLVQSWSDSVWVPCADGKVRRAPGDTVGLVDGLHRSILGGLGNSIVPQVAARIIQAMIDSEYEG